MSRAVFASWILAALFAQPALLSAAEVVVVDDTQAEITGNWVPSTHTKPFHGAGYLHDDNRDKGAKSIRFTLTAPAEGLYELAFSYAPGTNRCKATPVEIVGLDQSEIQNINQQKAPAGSDGFQPLGRYELKAGELMTVTITNAETSGYVIADAARLAPVIDGKVALGKPEAPANAPAETAKPKYTGPVIAVPGADRKFEKYTTAALDAELAAALGPVADSDLVDDPTFLRRATLDLCGRQPTVEEIEAFMADSAETRRAAAIDRLLASPDYGRNWANYWSDVISYRTQEPELTFLNYKPFKQWLAEQLNSGRGWDAITAEVLTASGKVGENPQATFIAFHQADHLKLAGETTRVFLGIQTACAECHDHPFIDMPTETFHGMAAFFVRTETKIPWNDSSGIELKSKDKGEHKVPGRKDPMNPTVLDGTEPPADLDDVTRRRALAEWVTAPGNPYFSKAIVNRLWARLMGRGFALPVDDIGEGAAEVIFPTVHDALAGHLVASEYDVREVLRVVLNSRVYQQSLNGSEEKPFARAVTKQLRADEVFDSLVTAIGLPNVTPEPEKPTGAFRFPPPPKSTRDRVVEAFGYDPSMADDLVTRTLPQAMYLMNNKEIQQQLETGEKSETWLAELLRSEADDSRAVEQVFLTVLARKPKSSEQEIAARHISSIGDRSEAFQDLLWSLLNSAEFLNRP